ncbi:unnamed protein product, partial [Discosporangium mesarthrocarpum]
RQCLSCQLALKPDLSTLARGGVGCVGCVWWRHASYEYALTHTPQAVPYGERFPSVCPLTSCRVFCVYVMCIMCTHMDTCFLFCFCFFVVSMRTCVHAYTLLQGGRCF